MTIALQQMGSPARWLGMSDLHQRSAARLPATNPINLPLVPPEIRASYAAAMAEMPRVRTKADRPAKPSESLPAAGSFYS